MYRIYVDGNEGTENDLFGLWLSKSIEDLAKIPGGPKEGMLVTIYEIGELEMEATLEWNSKWDAWTARSLEGTVRTNTETWDREAFEGEDREQVARPWWSAMG